MGESSSVQAHSVEVLAADSLARGDANEAIALLEPVVETSEPEYSALVTFARALDAVGRTEEALRVALRARPLARNVAVAERNLAILQERLGLFEDAEASARRSLKILPQSGETLAVLARAQLGLGRLSEAEILYREVVRLDPRNRGAQRDLAQLIWVQTEDVEAATAPLRAARSELIGDVTLSLEFAHVLRQMGHDQGAYAVLREFLHSGAASSADVLVALSETASALNERAEALDHALAAVGLAPFKIPAILALVDAYIGLGLADRAEPIIMRLSQRLPEAQEVTARLATVWRLLHDERYCHLYNYPEFVAVTQLDVPPGWENSSHYFAALLDVISSVHNTRAHPFDQSLRFGTQTHADLTKSSDSCLRDFFHAVDAPIRKYLQHLGLGTDPLRRRNVADYKFHSAWSTRLRSGGYHVNHVHRFGWISAVCYLQLPVADQPSSRAGWLKLGEPGINTDPALAPEWFVEPAPGKLVLFPSYIWHGTVPFEGRGSRLAIAFDLLPKTSGQAQNN
jgi:tetratricopeptide (TPR) repeat protein